MSEVKSRTDVRKGDKIVVTKYNGDFCQRGAIVKEVYTVTIDVQFCDSGELAVIYISSSGLDEWDYASEDYVQHEEETLQHRQSHAYYDDEALSPTYSDAVKAGMTFAEYTGVNITEESLDFEPKEEEVLRGITAESLNFEEAPKPDAVNHPSHYNRYSREVIESIKGLCTPEEFRGYLKGNIIKYSARYSGKDGLQDIDKLAKYTQFLKEFEIEMEGE